MPTPCPSRLKELIALANLKPDSEARKHLKAIADAFRAKRQGQKRRPLSLAFQSVIELQLEIDTGKITASLGEFVEALDQIDATQGRLDLVRECPVCSEIFWAGRADKEACDRHTGAWSKREWRRKAQEKKIEQARNRAKRIKRESTKPFKLSLTTATILDAVGEHKRTFRRIDDYCYLHLGKSFHSDRGMYRTVNVTRGLKLLTDLGYLNCFEPDPEELQDDEQAEPYYTPTQKLVRFRLEVLGPDWEDQSFRYKGLRVQRERPTH